MTLMKKTKKMGRPTLGTESDFRRFGGNPKAGLHGWEIYNAKDTLLLPIARKHIKNAKPKAPPECVVGLATSDFFCDKYDVEVGLTIVRVIDAANKKMLRFHLPLALRRSLHLFDKNSTWNLPTGLYRLYPMKSPKAKTRGTTSRPRPTATKARKKKIASPTRFISRGKVLKRTSTRLVRK